MGEEGDEEEEEEEGILLIEKCSDTSRECGVNKGERNCLCKRNQQTTMQRKKKDKFLLAK